MAETNDNFDDFLKQKKQKKGIFGKLLFALFVLLFFAGLIFVASDWALSALIHTRKEVPVPDLTNKPVSQALGLLAQQNLAIKQAGVEFSPNVAPGSVLRQIPTAGSTVREGRVIRVWISEGDEMVFVPNAVGTILRDAQLAIRQAGLIVEKVENAYSLTYEKGTIISQTPKAESLAHKGTGVALVLSNGQPPASVVLVPNFKGKKLAQATLWASTQDINLIIHEDENSVFPNGIIADQQPGADAQIAPKSNVDITVSRRATADNEKSYHLHYEMPQGKNATNIRITVEDATGETEILNDMKQPGSKIDIEIPYTTRATIRVFADGILVREREVL